MDGGIRDAIPWVKIGFGVLVVAVVGALVATAVTITGIYGGLVLGVGLVLGASIPLLLAYGSKRGTPGAGLLATGSAMLAQLTFAKSALVRTDAGDFQWRLLREDSDGYFVELEDGTRVEIDADRGELYPFKFGKLAITEQKTERNMSPLTVDADAGVQDQSTRETRGGYEIHHPEPLDESSWLVSLRRLGSRVGASGQPDIVRRGRNKALEEAGGQQALSGLYLTLLVGVMVVLGFGMGYGALAL
jgi:hypothetical protein